MKCEREIENGISGTGDKYKRRQVSAFHQEVEGYIWLKAQRKAGIYPRASYSAQCHFRY